MNETMPLQLRWMIRRDMDDVFAIERRSFDHFWTEEDFLSRLRQRNCIGMVAEHDGRIVGFTIYELLKSSLHVLNFAVCPTVRRRGAGAAMIDKLEAKLGQQKRTSIRVEVRETNIAAQLFFRAQGFQATEILRGYYDDTTEDAYRMRFVLSRNESPVAAVSRDRLDKFFSGE